MNPIVITDTHAHLDFPDFKEDLPQVLDRAASQGITRIITIGIGRESIQNAIRLSEKYPQVHAAVGVHPNDPSELPLSEWPLLLEAARHPRVVAIGETGLDYHRLKENPQTQVEIQKDYFLRQLDLARDIQKPVIIHCRDAYPDTLDILEKFGRFQENPGVMHCYGSDAETASRLFQLGYCISVGGILTFKNAETLRQIVKTMPRDRLLLETDCPFLAPAPHRGKRNEPAYTRLVAEKVAELWDIDLAETCNIIQKNVQQVFRI